MYVRVIPLAVAHVWRRDLNAVPLEPAGPATVSAFSGLGVAAELEAAGEPPHAAMSRINAENIGTSVCRKRRELIGSSVALTFYASTTYDQIVSTRQGNSQPIEVP